MPEHTHAISAASVSANAKFVCAFFVVFVRFQSTLKHALSPGAPHKPTNAFN